MQGQGTDSEVRTWLGRNVNVGDRARRGLGNKQEKVGGGAWAIGNGRR